MPKLDLSDFGFEPRFEDLEYDPLYFDSDLVPAADDPEPPLPEPSDPGWAPDDLPSGLADTVVPAQARGTKPAGTKAALELTWLADITPVLEASDFVGGILQSGAAVVIYGEANGGKTFWATTLALHVAAGLPWNGRRVEQGAVVYVALEGGHGFRNRVAAWCSANAVDATTVPFAAIMAPVNLLDPDADVQRLVDAVLAAGAHIGGPVRLVVLDTLSRALAGGDENSSSDMGNLVRAVDYVRAATGACVALIHHSGKDVGKGARGHSLLRAAVDTEIEVRADDTTGVRTAVVTKQRDLAKGASFGFALQPVTLGVNQHGEPVTSCVVVPEGHGQSSREVHLTPDERGWLKDISAFFDDPSRVHQGVRPTPNGGQIVGATRDEMRAWLVARGRLGVAGGVAGKDGLTATERSSLSRYLNRLKDKGKVGVFGDWIWLP